MPMTETLKLAFKSLWMSKMRSLLTMLGIIIGVAAVIIITAVGNGMENYVREMFESFGTNLMTVYTNQTPTRAVDVDDLFEYVKSKPELYNGVSPAVQITGTVKYKIEELETTKTTGVSENYGAMSNFKLKDGRFLQYLDIRQSKKVCVIGSYVDKTYFKGNGLGENLKINGVKYHIVGVLDVTAASDERGDDDTIYVPYTQALKVNGTRVVNQFTLNITSEKVADEAKQDIKSYLYDIFQDENAYYIMSMSELMGQMTNMLRVIVFVLSAIAAISLVVGGIGIMNITLVSVTERTREIGIRKALGAKRIHIMQQFIIEAATTSGIGGMIGIAVGIGLSSIFSFVIKSALNTTMALVPTMPAIMLAFGVSVTIGIVFGFLPARKAAKLSPIDALRYE